MPELSHTDRLSVTILCLPPVRRRRLAAVVLAGRPVRWSELRASDPAPKRLHRDLEALRRGGLISRDRGRRYEPDPLVPGLLAKIPSVVPGRNKVDPRDGLKVLLSARGLVEDEVYPSGRVIADMLGLPGLRRQAVIAWIKRLKAARLWPSCRGLDRHGLRARRRRAEAIARRGPADPKCLPRYEPTVHRSSAPGGVR